MIGVIGALDVEISYIIEKMESARTETFGTVTFTSGKINGKDIVCAVCGIGKVFAAMCAQTMILRYSPDCIINTGVGGSLCDDIKIFDVVIGTEVVQHDMNVIGLGHPRGYIAEARRRFFPCDEALVKKVTKAFHDADVTLHHGRIASGDIFIDSKDMKEKIKSEFNAVVCEMEGAAIGTVCYVNNVPFVAVRAISDNSNDDSKVDFPAFAAAAAKRSANVIINLLK